MMSKKRMAIYKKMSRAALHMQRRGDQATL
jgi:hypothetical protein